MSEHSFIKLPLPKFELMRIRDEKKEKLVIEKAIELIAREGFDAFSMNKLARASGISVATLYIYYKDKDDLVQQIGTDIGQKFFASSLKGFSTDMPFAEGLRLQWQNRREFAVNHPHEMECFEILRHTLHSDNIVEASSAKFKQAMTDFYTHSVAAGTLVPLDLEVFWSVAYGPFYALLRFERDGKSFGGRPFSMNDEVLNATFDLVLKALTP